MSSPNDDEETLVRQLHDRYFASLRNGDMDALADQFVFPAAFKGFLDDVVIAEDKPSLLATYEQLIAAAPKASSTELRGRHISRLRPGVYMLTMSYIQKGAEGELIHEGQAVYFAKRVRDSFKLFAVF